MITKVEIEKLRDNDLGRAVVYQDRDAHIADLGIITSWNDHYIFVDYGQDRGIATYARDLCWAIEKELVGRVLDLD